MNKKVIIYIIVFIVLLIGIAGSYVLFKKFLEDRQRVSGFSSRKLRRPSPPKSGQPEVRTYTAEEIEKLRKEGRVPPGMNPVPGVPQTNTTDQVQKTLRTIEEINRINEMNRRVMEQNQRMQNQR